MSWGHTTKRAGKTVIRDRGFEYGPDGALVPQPPAEWDEYLAGLPHLERRAASAPQAEAAAAPTDTKKAAPKKKGAKRGKKQ
jgi:hypothetical protein